MIYWVAKYFKASDIWYGHGTDNCWNEAKKLVLTLLSFSLNALSLIQNVKLSNRKKNHIIKYAIRRVNERIPVSYLVNKSWFCGYEFYVDKRVLIPRSPIGELINNRFSGLIIGEPKNILDMCTGSGCIAISCALTFKKSRVDAVDISSDALSVAKYNIKNYKLDHRIRIIQSNLFNKLKKKYDLIITNPPYVNIEEMHNLPDEYHHEPKLGLFAKNNGLQLIYCILMSSSDYLSKFGILICEVGNRMSSLIKQYPKIPFIWLEFKNGGDGVFMLTKEQLVFVKKYLWYLKSKNCS